MLLPYGNPKSVKGLPIPERLRELIAKGWWPRSSKEVGEQESVRPLVTPAIVQRSVPSEKNVVWYCTPFRRISDQSEPVFIRRHHGPMPPTLPAVPKMDAEDVFFLRQTNTGYDQFSRSFWLQSVAAPSELDHRRAIDIGDFGLGSDAPIVLDYQGGRTEPRVVYLKYGEKDGRFANHWLELAPCFAELADRWGMGNNEGSRAHRTSGWKRYFSALR